MTPTVLTVAPKRIQLRRTKGWRIPADTIIVARPTRWGNPYRTEQLELVAMGTCEGSVGAYDVDDVLNIDMSLGRGHATAAMAVELYEAELLGSLDDGHPHYDEMRKAFGALRGRDLACWCPLDAPCHADVLLRLANR